MKVIIVFGLLLLTACSGTHLSKNLNFSPLQSAEQKLFITALDQYSATSDLTLMDDLRLRYPDSIWATRAETIATRARELNDLKTQLHGIQTEDQQLLDQLAALKQENLQLAEQIAQLKALLIELEQRPQ